LRHPRRASESAPSDDAAPLDLEEALRALTVAELKEQLSERGLAATGNKADLVQRLAAAMEEEEDEEEGQWDEFEGEVRVEAGAAGGAGLSSAEQQQWSRVERLVNGHSKAELQDMCRWGRERRGYSPRLHCMEAAAAFVPRLVFPIHPSPTFCCTPLAWRMALARQAAAKPCAARAVAAGEFTPNVHTPAGTWACR
jgi:hypothetical protein